MSARSLGLRHGFFVCLTHNSHHDLANPCATGLKKFQSAHQTTHPSFITTAASAWHDMFRQPARQDSYRAGRLKLANDLDRFLCSFASFNEIGRKQFNPLYDLFESNGFVDGHSLIECVDNFDDFARTPMISV